MPYYPINEDAARRAKAANSFSDYIPGTATARYKSMVDEAAEIVERQKKKVDPMYHEKIDRLFDTYCRKLADNLNAANAIDARVPSIMIAGGSNFPVRKKEKQNAARDRNMEEYNYIQGLLRKIESTGTGGISSDDKNALEKLRKKLAGREQLQTIMKAVNTYFRKNKTLDGCPDLKPEYIEKLKDAMIGSWRDNAVPFESYELTLNNAEIRRLKGRIEELEKRQKEPAPEGWDFAGGRVEMNTTENRVQIFFDTKPDEETRSILKGYAFRWAPSQGAWQRQLTRNGINAAKAALKEIFKEEQQ